MKTLQEINEAISALESRANEALAAVEAGDKTATEAKALLEEMKPTLTVLNDERESRMRDEEMKSLQGEFSNLQKVIEDLRKPAGAFKMDVPTVDDDIDPDTKALEALDHASYGRKSGHTVFSDVWLANQGNSEAKARLTEGFTGLNAMGKLGASEVKAMTEGVNAQGGYLVRPLIERQIVLARELDNVLRGLCSTLNVTSPSIQLDQIGLTTTAGWAAELAQKTEGTSMTLATVTANVFTAAGLVTISNQLLADSNPAIDGLATADITKRLVALEESAFLNGSGTNQPLGILNTPGIGATPLTATDVLSLLDAILDSIATVETSHGAPSAILMHPRTWTRILKARDAQGAYYIDPTGGPQDPRTGQRGPAKTLWGYPVVTTNRMPTNLGGGTNESRVIVGDFKEALILDRQGITVDQSQHVYFTTNQTVFRAEERVGFTAARTPYAFNVVGGAGLANG